MSAVGGRDAYLRGEGRAPFIAALALSPLFGWALAAESWYILATLVLVACIPVILRWPVISTFGVYAFLIPFDSVAAIAEIGGSTLTRLVGLLSAAVLLADGMLRRGLVRPPFAALWWGLFVFWAALSAAWALDLGPVLERLPTAASLFLLYVVAVSIKPSRQGLLATCMLAVLGGMIAAGITYFYTDTADDSVRGTLVIEGRSANPNKVAAGLIPPLALAIGGYVSLRGVLRKTAAIAAVGLIGAGIYITAARQAVVAIVAMVIFFMVRFRARWQILVAVAVLLVLVAAMPQAITGRIEALFTGEDTTGSGRTIIWEVGIAALERFGMVGAGFSNFTGVFNLLSPFGPRLGPLGAHNTYLGAWVELGIVGLVLVLGAVGSHLWAAHHSRVGADSVMLSAIEGACLGMLVIAFFQDILWSKEFWFIWILSTWATRAGPETEHREDRLLTNPSIVRCHFRQEDQFQQSDHGKSDELSPKVS